MEYFNDQEYVYGAQSNNAREEVYESLMFERIDALDEAAKIDKYEKNLMNIGAIHVPFSETFVVDTNHTIKWLTEKCYDNIIASLDPLEKKARDLRSLPKRHKTILEYFSKGDE